MLTFWTEDSLKKVFRDDGPTQWASREIVLKAARNEREDAQICVRTNAPVKELSVSFSSLVGTNGARLSEKCLRHDFVGYVPCHENTQHNGNGAHIIRRAPDFFPDPFLEQPVISLLPNLTQPIWITVAVPEDAAAGEYRGTVTVKADTENVEIPIRVTVWNFTLPKTSRLWMTNWFFTGGMESWYKAEPFSERWWQVVEYVAQNMGEHRQNVILTHLSTLIRTTRKGKGFTYDYTNFDRWVSTFDKYGCAEIIEGGHLGGRAGDWNSPFVWGHFTVHNEDESKETLQPAPVDDKARQALVKDFLQNLKKHLEEKGWYERFIIHLADEPVAANVESWREMSKFVSEVLPGVRRIDAVMCEGLDGFVEIRVPQIQEVKDAPIPKGEELWFYTCLAPQGAFPNRFLDFSSLKTRILHWLNWRYGATGYLHWGYAHWVGWNGSPGVVDPWYSATGASERLKPGTLRLPPGDPHIVYPGKEKICNSIRWEMLRKGMEDYDYFRLVEDGIQRLGEKHPTSVEAQKLLEEIRATLLKNHSEYTRDDAALLSAREKLAEMIVKLSGS